MELRELKVGNFVRTKDGRISKLMQIKEDDEFNLKYYCFEENIIHRNYEESELKQFFIKASDKLIDLVEAKDIVKVRIDNMFINYFVVDIFEAEEENEVLGIACYEDGMLNTISEYRPLDTLEILEVLTHQQFDQESYKVSN